MVGDIEITFECTVTELNNVNNVVTYTYFRQNYDNAFNGQTLSCQVKMPEYDWVQASAVIQVRRKSRK